MSKVNENPNVKSSYGNIRLIEIRRILTDKYTSLLERVESNELENHIQFPVKWILTIIERKIREDFLSNIIKTTVHAFWGLNSQMLG